MGQTPQILDALCQLFQAPFTRLGHLELNHLAAVYGTPQQLFAIAAFPSEQELEAGWQQVAHEVAYKIQGRLQGEFDELRWDLYLVLLVTDSSVRPEMRKKIENDQRYFRKLVLAAEDHPFTDRLPFRFVVKEQEQMLLFEERQFLQELRGCLSERAVERLGADFFEAPVPHDHDSLLGQLRERFARGGGADENSRG